MTTLPRDPFQGTDRFTVVRRIGAGGTLDILRDKHTVTPPSLHALAPTVPAEVSDLCDRLLERRADHRLRARDIVAALAGESAPVERAGAFRRRHRAEAGCPGAGADTFNRAMTGISAMTVDALIGAYSFARFRTVAGIGGGHGRLPGTILKQYPALHAVLLDLPGVVASGKFRAWVG